MVDYTDSEVFNDYQRVVMEPSSEPVDADFDDDPDTLMWVNVAGEMRLYSYNGAKVQYQLPDLGAKVDA